MNVNGTQFKGHNKKQFYFEHINLWQESGLNQNQYCKKHGIKLTTLLYWRKRYFENEEKPAPDKAFTQIKIKELPKPNVAVNKRLLGDSLAILLPNGIEMVLPITIEDQRITKLIQSLWGAVC